MNIPIPKINFNYDDKGLTSITLDIEDCGRISIEKKREINSIWELKIVNDNWKIVVFEIPLKEIK